MYHYTVLYLIIYKCVHGVSLKTGFVCPRVIHPRNSGVNLERDRILTVNPNEKVLMYTKDGINLKLPRFSRPRRRFVRILEKASRVDYLPVESLLERVKDRTTFCNFANIEATFLQIAKWVFFRRKELINHELFPELRLEALRKSALFGAVYSRFLKDALKASRLYGGYGIRNSLKFYVKVRDGNFLEELSLPSISEFDLALGDIPNSFYSRLLNLCRRNDRLEALNSVFRNLKVRTGSLVQDFMLSKSKFVESNWGYLCFHAVRRARKSVLKAINEICRPKEAGRFDHLKTGESDLEFASRHFGTVLNLFSQVYKMSTLVSTRKRVPCERPNDLLSKLGICVLKKETSERELYSIYYKSKLELLKLSSLEDHVATFMEMVDYLNGYVQSGDCDYDYLDAFIHCVCRPYMAKIKDHFGHVDGKLEAIFAEMFPGPVPGHNLTLTERSIESLRHFGLERFASLFQKAPEVPSGDKLYGIMRDLDSSFLYDFVDSRILTSSNTDSMDQKNFRGNCLDSVKYCHLIVHSTSEDLDELLDRNFTFLREKYKQLDLLKIDPLVTLDLPGYGKGAIREFDRKRLQHRALLRHPVNSQLYITLNDWSK
ncbi:hypothetical protein TOT_040000525 [Theileria orientalis strain Shintoku]|uniref:Uncharacterized protein n=1 Tax=Theileria orientalis strain Shintoku TaxID=869250 RepID=J4DAS0_THEOR|nr:hypothetical protein TOT_040000525 [Theileria orientalis strain Shintoku]BAM42155.1 hypothetical protein TOT_040000525 [Theileria orientalis strain Shintoku]|eukprot:XP_009692456.1 hypothetical protein TOT_040000525 [Theileria orientalis strain Shintoku]